MPVLSGKDGTLRLGNTEVLHVVFWQIEKTAAARAYTANDTGGARRRVSGVKDATGRLEVKATESGNVPVAEGDPIELELHADNSGENYYVLAAIVDSVRVEVHISEGTPVAYAIRFSADGPVTAHGVLERG
jgi:hypothetical protein